MTEVAANATSPESTVPSQERATTRQSASEARMNEACDFIAAFNADPTQCGQCSVCIEMEACVFDGDGADGHIHIDEEMSKGMGECFLSTPSATPSVDALVRLMEA